MRTFPGTTSLYGSSFVRFSSTTVNSIKQSRILVPCVQLVQSVQKSLSGSLSDFTRMCMAEDGQQVMPDNSPGESKCKEVV